MTTPAQLVTFTAGLIGDVLSGQLDPEAARVVVAALGVQRWLIETAELERCLTAPSWARPTRPTRQLKKRAGARARDSG